MKFDSLEYSSLTSLFAGDPIYKKYLHASVAGVCPFCNERSWYHYFNSGYDMLLTDFSLLLRNPNDFNYYSQNVKDLKINGYVSSQCQHLFKVYYFYNFNNETPWSVHSENCYKHTLPPVIPYVENNKPLQDKLVKATISHDYFAVEPDLVGHKNKGTIYFVSYFIERANDLIEYARLTADDPLLDIRYMYRADENDPMYWDLTYWLKNGSLFYYNRENDSLSDNASGFPYANLQGTKTEWRLDSRQKRIGEKLRKKFLKTID